MTQYTWRTDAASGRLYALDADAALRDLIAQNEWAEIGTPRECREIEDGAWLTISDADGVPVLLRGSMP